MILVINKKWLRRKTSQAFQEDIFHPRIYRNIFSEQYWECSGNKKGSRKSSASLSIYFLNIWTVFLLKGDFLRTTAASAQKRFQQFCFIKALIPPVHCSSSSHEYPGCSYRRISRISSGRPHAPKLRPRRSGGGYCSYSPGENG